MKSYKILYFCICACLLSGITFSSCTTSKSVNLLQDKKPIYVSKAYRDYRLQYNDEITCTIYSSNKDFSDNFNGIIANTEQNNTVSYYTIFDNGNISIPYFGDIHIVGRTLSEAETIIENKMREAFPDAQVKINLKNNFYYVVSDGQNGAFPIYKDNMTIYQALASNGSPSIKIDLSKVKIVRTDMISGKSSVKTFDLRSESVIESEYYYIKPNDVIYYSTSKASFFKIGSLSSLISTIGLPISIVATVLATKIK